MNMKRILGICVLCVVASLTANAQVNEFEKEFKEFTRQAKKSYTDFRNKANQEYADFMRQAWKLVNNNIKVYQKII